MSLERIEKLCRDESEMLTGLIGNDDSFTDREREVQADAYLNIAGVIKDALLLQRSRPGWDEYFLNIAEVVSTRSTDPHTHHGCVLVDDNNRIISAGYNGPPRGFPNDLVPETRPAKYAYHIHAEDNACLFARCDLSGATAYVTGAPCSACFRRLAQAGVKRIVHAGRSSACVDDSEKIATDQMATHLGIEMVAV